MDDVDINNCGYRDVLNNYDDCHNDCKHSLIVLVNVNVANNPPFLSYSPLSYLSARY